MQMNLKQNRKVADTGAYTTESPRVKTNLTVQVHMNKMIVVIVESKRLGR